ncbi:MAG: polyphosphate kinase 2 family protein [Armatimonadota bacterium]|jgi:PPK2 family polyphosphate:nucleotide phosphotransferase
MEHFTKVEPGAQVRLDEIDPEFRGDLRKRDIEVAERIEAAREEMRALQERLYAECEQSLLIVLQAIDTGGKDGTIKHVMRGLNPAGVCVVGFKQPTPRELAHDFLWRIHPHTPAKGHIAVFNRSHYEDVLVVRVHNLVPESVWRRRYDQINEFERLLAENGTRILKLFLCISKDEQKERLQARLDNPDKHWKFAPGDLAERERWVEYIEAFEEALTRCSTEHAPWHIIPANRKWFRNLTIAELVAGTLREMDPQFPEPDFDPAEIVIK